MFSAHSPMGIIPLYFTWGREPFAWALLSSTPSRDQSHILVRWAIVGSSSWGTPPPHSIGRNQPQASVAKMEAASLECFRQGLLLACSPVAFKGFERLTKTLQERSGQEWLQKLELTKEAGAAPAGGTEAPGAAGTFPTLAWLALRTLAAVLPGGLG